MPRYLPDEIGAIVKGAVVETVGLAVNEGRATWRALDLDRREVVVVERYAGPRLERAPRVAPSTSHEYLKTTGQDKARWVDHVRRYPLSPAAFTTLACVAAGAWSDHPAASRDVSDTGSRFYLLLAQTAQVDSARGRFEGPAGEIARRVDEIVKRQRPGARPR